MDLRPQGGESKRVLLYWYDVANLIVWIFSDSNVCLSLSIQLILDTEEIHNYSHLKPPSLIVDDFYTFTFMYITKFFNQFFLTFCKMCHVGKTVS